MSDFSAVTSNAVGFVQEGAAKQENHKVAASEEQGRNINLRDAIEWLLGNQNHASDEEHSLTDEERSARKERRKELLVWLMNLEPRLSPYKEPA